MRQQGSVLKEMSKLLKDASYLTMEIPACIYRKSEFNKAAFRNHAEESMKKCGKTTVGT